MVARQAHNLKVVGSIPSSATKKSHLTEALGGFVICNGDVFIQ